MGTNRPSEPPYANEATQASAPLTRKQKYALLVGILGSFYPGFAGSALNLAIPQMGADFGMGAAAVGWIVTVFVLVFFSVCTEKVKVTGFSPEISGEK